MCPVWKAPLTPVQFLRLTTPRITRRRSLKRLLTSGTSNSRTSQFPNQRKSRALLAHSCLFAWSIPMPVSRIDHVAIPTDISQGDVPIYRALGFSHPSQRSGRSQARTISLSSLGITRSISMLQSSGEEALLRLGEKRRLSLLGVQPQYQVTRTSVIERIEARLGITSRGIST